MNKFIWKRVSPNSINDFDLLLINPERLDFVAINKLLDSILIEKHRGLTLSTRASKELQRWFGDRETPLKSDAYVQLSNWFMTQSGDRLSKVATRCEELWDALFPCRPLERLSSPKAGRNHVVVPAAFESFWNRVLETQSKDPKRTPSTDADYVVKPQSLVDAMTDTDAISDPLRATFDKDGLHFQVEGSPRSLADFLQMVSGWAGSPKT